MEEIFIYGERSQLCVSLGALARAYRLPTGLPYPRRHDQVARARLFPVSLLYSLSETLISSYSASSPRSNTPSLSLPPYRILYQSLRKLCMNPHYLATDYNDQFFRFLDHMAIRRSNHPWRFVHTGDILV